MQELLPCERTLLVCKIFCKTVGGIDEYWIGTDTWHISYVNFSLQWDKKHGELLGYSPQTGPVFALPILNRKHLKNIVVYLDGETINHEVV